MWPPVWSDAGGRVGRAARQSCGAGLQYHDPAYPTDREKVGVTCMWYTNYTHILGQPTLEPELRTFPK